MIGGLVNELAHDGLIMGNIYSHDEYALNPDNCTSGWTAYNELITLLIA